MRLTIPDQRIDWFRVLADLCEGGVSLYRLARLTSIPRTTLQAYRRGVEPPHSVGSLLLIAWSIKTGRDPFEAPTVIDLPGESRPARSSADGALHGQTLE